MPTSPTLTRRSAFRLTAGALMTGLGFAATVSCGADTDTAAIVDSLTTHLTAARRDAAAAGALIAVSPQLSAPLAVVQSERTAHGDALEAEIERVSGTADPTKSLGPTTTTSGPPPSLEELKSMLSGSQRSAADAARSESGFRAGLLGAISAACAVEVAAVLA